MCSPLKQMSYSGFSASSTAEEVTSCIDGSSLVAIVTGGSHGIGAETCRVLALRGVHVVMAMRNPSAGGHVKEEIERQVPTAKIDIMELDLSSMKSVRRFANNFEALNLPLNILVNNAGIACVPFLLSEDGIELQFATNYLGHFLLTDLLLKKMKATAEESGLEGRIVIVASASHKFSYREGIRFNKINDKSGYHRYSAYCQKKLANILHSNVLSNQLKEQNAQVVVNSLDPGVSVTNILNHLPFVQGKYMLQYYIC
ncbi:hypothetical protein HU200_063094 [Digitaria exilis]|uniref:Uncharacterized protein n=1 Tax=Digitaria exilis TaxID=1010633 RepID=A0A835A9B2_9POAL|nr:hypothetical protein HU200_063094 [Digitaria exilis]